MDQKSSLKSNLMQVALTSVATIPAVPSGMALGYSAVIEPFMTKQNPTLFLNQHEFSLIVSLLVLSALPGSLIAGVLLEKYGRKFNILMACLLSSLGWFTIAAFPSYSGVASGRILTGLAMGVTCPSSAVYTAEGSTPEIRKIMINGVYVGFTIGTFIVYMLGLTLQEDWRVTATICGVFPMIGIVIIIIWLPESPVWLASKGKSTEALKSLAKLRGSHHQSPEVSTELQELTKNIKRGGKKLSIRETLSTFTKPEAYKPLFIINIFFFFLNFSGASVVIFYGVRMVKDAGVTVDAFLITVFIGLINAALGIFGCWASGRYGKRPTAIWSGLGMTISLFSLTIHLYLTAEDSREISHEVLLNTTSVETSASNEQSWKQSWLPISSLFLFILSRTVIFCLPWSMMGEIFPTKIRGVASGLTTCISYFLYFVILYIYHDLSILLGNMGIFAFFCIMSFIGTIFLAIFLPETNNKTLDQIEKYFAGKSSIELNEERLKLNA